MSPTKTAGFKIKDVRLTYSAFNWLVESAPTIEPAPITGDRIQLEVGSTASPTEAGYGPFHVDLRVTARGLRSGSLEWEILVQYRGTFDLGEPSALTPEAARAINGPAVLYSYAREHIGDLTRRAGIGLVLLPPMQFTPKPPK